MCVCMRIHYIYYTYLCELNEVYICERNGIIYLCYGVASESAGGGGVVPQAAV